MCHGNCPNGEQTMFFRTRNVHTIRRCENDSDERYWRNAHWVGLVQKLRAPAVWGPHQPRPIAQKIRKRKKCRYNKNQLENAKIYNAK